MPLDTIHDFNCRLLAELPVRDYLARMSERPTVQKVNADRKSNTEELMARMQAKAAR